MIRQIMVLKMALAGRLIYRYTWLKETIKIIWSNVLQCLPRAG